MWGNDVTWESYQFTSFDGWVMEHIRNISLFKRQIIERMCHLVPWQAEKQYQNFTWHVDCFLLILLVELYYCLPCSLQIWFLIGLAPATSVIFSQQCRSNDKLSLAEKLDLNSCSTLFLFSLGRHGDTRRCTTTFNLWILAPLRNCSSYHESWCL